MREHVVLSRFDSATVDEGKECRRKQPIPPACAGAVYYLHKARSLKPPGSGNRGMGPWGLLMFYNISNHPSAKWSAEQLTAARSLGGEVRDVAFPNVAPGASYLEVATMANGLVLGLGAKPGDVCMVQGEFTLTYMLTWLLRRGGCVVVAACTDRKVQERVLEGGKVEKTATFEFVQFREVVEPPPMSELVRP